MGLLSGGTVTGLLLLVPSAALQELFGPSARLQFLIACVLVCAALELRLMPFRLPQNARQVPSNIIARTDGSGALQFGFEMGTGLRTYIPTHLPYLTVSIALIATPWWWCPVLGVGFGAGRVLMVISTTKSGSADHWNRRFQTRRRAIVAILWVGAIGCLVPIARSLMP
jgi:uncharacterized membrane protein YecN with MAPEG domain